MGIAVELIDCMIRILDALVEMKIDPEEVLRLKMDYNNTRPPGQSPSCSLGSQSRGDSAKQRLISLGLDPLYIDFHVLYS